MNPIIDFYRTDPVVAWFLTLAFVVLLAGCLYAVLLANEEKKAERLAQERRVRQRYDAAISVWPPPPGPKGFDRNRNRGRAA